MGIVKAKRNNKVKVKTDKSETDLAFNRLGVIMFECAQCASNDSTLRDGPKGGYAIVKQTTHRI